MDFLTPCTCSIPVELPMTNGSIISNMHELVIEATTSNIMLHWPRFPFGIKAQMKDELCKRVHYLSLGSNKDIAAFSLESPLCCLRWIWQRCTTAWEQNWNVLGNRNVSVSPLWTVTAWLTDLQPELSICRGTECCIVDHRWRGWILITERQSRLVLTIHHCLKVCF